MSDEEIAKAILGKRRSVLSGREIDLCERVISGEYAEDQRLLRDSDLNEDSDHMDEECCESEVYPDDDTRLFESLQVQFASEIAEHEREYNARICRKTLRREAVL